MTERKRDHFATVVTVLILAVAALTFFCPVATIIAGAAAAAVSLPIVIWSSLRASL